MQSNYNPYPVNHYDDEKRPTKAYLENHIYTEKEKMITSNVIALSGPNLPRHIGNAKKIAKNKKCCMYFIEIDPNIFNEMKRHKQNPSLDTNRVKISQGDILRYQDVFDLAYPCRFIDADLCQALPGHNGSRYLLSHLIMQQSTNKTKRYKCFIFTSSLRIEGGLKETLTDLNIMLKEVGAEISVEFTMEPKIVILKQGVKRRQPVFIKRGRLLKNSGLVLYTYKDTTPMMTCVITYK